MLRILMRGLWLLLGATVLGFFVFAETVTRLAPHPDPPAADGVVVLTGGGGARIAAGMALLQAKKGQRLLISGVNPSATADDIAKIAGGPADLFACCVDLDHVSRSTKDNARETALWARRNGFGSLIVVTSDFHVPRSLAELGAAARGVSLRAYPVQAQGAPGAPWWRDAAKARRLAVEYAKYLAILGRNAVGLGAVPPEAAPAPGPASP